jgi:hypothetical protein
MGCEFCGRSEVYLSFVPLFKYQHTFIMCAECFISFMAQYYQWDHFDVNEYADWVGVEGW